MLPDSDPELIERHDLDEVLVQSASRLPEQFRRNSALLKERDEFISPKQFSQSQRIDGRIHLNRPRCLEVDATARSAAHDLDAPPLGHAQLGFFNMPLTDHKRRPVKHLAVDVHLGGQSSQGVGIALDLVTVQKAVDDSYVHSDGPVAQAEFVKHERVWLPMMLAQNAAMKRLSHLAVSHSGPALRRAVRSCPLC
nr:hypothetical protein [Bradyrhizobium liaoningense]